MIHMALNQCPRREKLLEKARRNPRGLRFEEFEALLRQCGWTKDRQSGSHRIWYSPSGFRLSVQPRGDMAKGYQVEQFLGQHEKEASHEKG